ncbi:MAG: polyprenyl synthetase family protein [Proteobacteria bacterium]|nr:polyprenyl synthetase family protein [Pseudomonadota bacterium]MBU1711316.1 polyprenyl synthetase family protein [Pseudomonadota bacterium]
MNFKETYDQKRTDVEHALEKLMLRPDGRLADHIKAMRYSLFAGGKRVRPVLCIAASQTIDPAIEPVMTVACAFECIHTYSLIHDDLPAMDNDDLRRGKPTNHKVFGEAEAILAGDGLLTYAFELLSDPHVSSRIFPENQLRLIRIIAQAAGSLGMVGGQAIDMDSEGKEISFDTLQYIHSRKTGALITASVQAGAICANASKDQFAALTCYGEKIGLAFQIVDDLLNVEGTTEQLGKSAGSDAELEKATYPAYFGVETSRSKAHEAISAAKDILDIFGGNAVFLRELADYILTRKK